MKYFKKTLACLALYLMVIVFSTYSIPIDSPEFILKISSLFKNFISIGFSILIAINFSKDLFNLFKVKI